MKNRIQGIKVQEIKDKLNITSSEIRKVTFEPFFRSLEKQYDIGYSSRSPSIKVEKITKVEDLEKIPSRPGIYLIFTNYQDPSIQDNKCTLTLQSDTKAKVIYRGESYKVSNRLESHLFHNTYHQELRKQSGRSDNYAVCLKINNENINLDKASVVSEANWYVAYHGLPSSNRFIREIAEKAFDSVYHKPICSRD